MNRETNILGDLAGLDLALADYADERDGQDLLALLDTYARDLMGGGDPLSEGTRERLLPGLNQVPGAFSMIARIGGEPVGLANCFMGYSTFAAAPLVNIHDFVVVARYRGRGIARALLAAVEAEAAKRGACKITLEVLKGNAPAKSLYASCGFGDYELDPASGHALFWQKKL